MDTLHEESLVLPKRYAHLCQQSICAAFLLYQFEKDAYTEDECASLDQRDVQAWLYSDAYLAKRLYGLFDCSQVYTSVCFLRDANYISVAAHEGNKAYYVRFNFSEVENASQSFYREKMLADEKRYASQEKHTSQKPTSYTMQPQQEHKTEAGRVAYQCKRATDLELPATLTLEQWLVTLTHFEWKCAYCKGKYKLLEHFIPLTQHGGTTQSNCVPACYKCNSLKGPYHPSALPVNIKNQMQSALEAVQIYLETCRSEE